MIASTLPGVFAACVLALGNSVVLLLGRSAVRGTLARNHSFGIRTRWTLASDEAWAAGHRAGGEAVRIAGFGSLVLAVLAALSGFLPLLGISEAAANTTIAVLILSGCAWLVAWLLVAAAAANRAAKLVLAQE